MTSPRASIPKSPWQRFAGCRRRMASCARERGRNFPPDQADCQFRDGDRAPASEEDVDGFAKVASSRALTSSMARARLPALCARFPDSLHVPNHHFAFSTGRGNAAPLRIPGRFMIFPTRTSDGQFFQAGQQTG